MALVRRMIVTPERLETLWKQPYQICSSSIGGGGGNELLAPSINVQSSTSNDKNNNSYHKNNKSPSACGTGKDGHKDGSEEPAAAAPAPQILTTEEGCRMRWREGPQVEDVDDFQRAFPRNDDDHHHYHQYNWMKMMVDNLPAASILVTHQSLMPTKFLVGCCCFSIGGKDEKASSFVSSHVNIIDGGASKVAWVGMDGGGVEPVLRNEERFSAARYQCGQPSLHGEGGETNSPSNTNNNNKKKNKNDNYARDGLHINACAATLLPGGSRASSCGADNKDGHQDVSKEPSARQEWSAAAAAIAKVGMVAEDGSVAEAVGSLPGKWRQSSASYHPSLKGLWIAIEASTMSYHKTQTAANRQEIETNETGAVSVSARDAGSRDAFVLFLLLPLASLFVWFVARMVLEEGQLSVAIAGRCLIKCVGVVVVVVVCAAVVKVVVTVATIWCGLTACPASFTWQTRTTGIAAEKEKKPRQRKKTSTKTKMDKTKNNGGLIADLLTTIAGCFHVVFIGVVCAVVADLGERCASAVHCVASALLRGLGLVSSAAADSVRSICQEAWASLSFSKSTPPGAAATRARAKAACCPLAQRQPGKPNRMTRSQCCFFFLAAWVCGKYVATCCC